MSGVIFAPSPATGTSLRPPSASAAPHSEVMTWLAAWQNTAPQGGVRWLSESAFAAVPDAIRCTETSRSNSADMAAVTRAVMASPP